MISSLSYSFQCTLFSAYTRLSAFQLCEKGILFRLRTSGRVFNLRRFNAKSKTFQELIREILYADDAEFLGHIEDDTQHLIDGFVAFCTAFGIKINLKKTKVIFTPAPREPYIEPNIMIHGIRLNVVDTFVYLRSTLSRDGSINAEIHLCILLFSRFSNIVFTDTIFYYFLYYIYKRERTVYTKLFTLFRTRAFINRSFLQLTISCQRMRT